MISIRQIEEFKENEVWRNFKLEMQEMRLNVLEQMAKETEIMGVARGQGRAEVLADLILWPELQLEEAIRETDKNKKENE